VILVSKYYISNTIIGI